MTSCSFLRVLDVDEKSEALLSLAALQPTAPPGARRFDVDPANFGALPGSPFAYWAPTSLVDLFSRWPSFRESGFEAMQGAKTNDDARFIRLGWEVPPTRSAAAGRTQAKDEGGSELQEEVDGLTSTEI